MHIVSCDGGMFLPSFGPEKLLSDDKGVYRSDSAANVHITLAVSCSTMCFTQLQLRAPAGDRDLSVERGIVFVSKGNRDRCHLVIH